MKKLNTLLGFVLICSIFGKLSAQTNMDSAVIKTIKIKGHIHMLQWSGAGNMMLLSGKDGNILIDDQFAPLSERINAAIQAIHPGPVKFLFNTHSHRDHTGGNENFGKSGAIIIAHENVRARLSGDSSKVRFAESPKILPAVAFPVITFGENMNVYLNNEDVFIFHVDNAHTDGDAVFYMPKSNVIHAGDCFMKDRFPYIDVKSGGSVKGWIFAVSRILAIIDDATVIIPGHGDLANKKDYENIRSTVSGLYDAVKLNIDAGRNLEQILALKITKDYDTTYGSGFIKGDALVSTMYKELRGEK